MRKKSLRKPIVITVLIALVAMAGGAAVVAFGHTSPRKTVATHQTKLNSSTDSAPRSATKEVTITLPNASPVTARIADYGADNDLWVLVDKNRPLSDADYAPSPIARPNVAEREGKSDAELSVRSDVVPAVEKLFAGAKAAGYDLVVASGYRSAALQKQYFDAYVASDGLDAATRYSARPGQSEHQTGLAFDITTPSRVCYLTACFADTPEAAWVAAHAHEYGFIVRYPKDKEAITGYEYEPWHLRYLGTDLAAAVHASGLTYEEAWPYLTKADDQLRAEGRI